MAGGVLVAYPQNKAQLYTGSAIRLSAKHAGKFAGGRSEHRVGKALVLRSPGAVALLQSRLAPAHPFIPERFERVGLQDSLRQRKYDALFLVEVLARRRNYPNQKLLRDLQVSGFTDLDQCFLDKL